ncbi:antibiotic biosynthesis monooxygenase [Amycolatopsis decaplanina]|uniref:antibiotic biosynthesis monooxygenase n=1 Tax=Amycolatopsis decaplanina TaxID=208441 RepID=UPI001376A8D1|nr:antibiotic biosynthesis monooxygenase [Amycolatopsis decaplanina]
MFTTTVENRQKLLELLIEGEEELRGFHGLVSANLHLSEDGTRIIGYSQWEDSAAFDRMRAKPDRAGHFAQVRALVTKVELLACRVAYTSDGD